ncbi:2'-5' RNA ligase [Bradyrhizobiaceae bacterium SG-6C]|nr:2'-5' RNA ligase [Bradyrhizobiaceae bacterium SG-6C]
MSERSLPRGLSGWKQRQPLFFALLLMPDDQQTLTALASECCCREGLTGAPTPGPRFHLSLHAVGGFAELPDRIVSAAAKAAASVHVPAFAVAFDRTMTFQIRQPANPFVLCAGDGMMALDSLHGQLGQALRRVGLGQHVSRRFTPHITLLYDRRCVPERLISPITFRFDSFVLIHSLVDPRRHVHVARWPLRS